LQGKAQERGAKGKAVKKSKGWEIVHGTRKT